MTNLGFLSFIGKVSNYSGGLDPQDPPTEESLSIENTLWANTVVASGTALGIVIYSGPECRATMNNSAPRSKVGLIDLELNQLTKVYADSLNPTSTVLS